MAKGLLGVAGHGGLTTGLEGLGRFRDPTGHVGRYLVESIRQAEASGQVAKRLVEQGHRLVVKVIESLLSDLGSNERVPITITTDPGAKRHPRQGGCLEQLRIESGVLPGRAQPIVDARNDLGKHPGQIVDDIAELVGYFGAFQEDLPRPPQPLQRSLDIAPDRPPLLRGPHLVFASYQLEVDSPVLLQHGGSLGFGWMSGEHRLHFQSGEAARNGGPVMASGLELSEHPAP